MRFLPLLLTCLAAITLTGCGGYKLGSTTDFAAGEKTIHVSPFLDRTMQPRLGDAVTAGLRRHLQQDATFRLANRDEADIVVTGVLTHYDRHELSLLPNDVLTVNDFRINVKARVTAKDRSGKTLVDKEVSGYTIVRVGADLTSSERRALPILARELAKNIATQLVDGSW